MSSNNGRHGKYNGPYGHLSSVKFTDEMYGEVVREAAYLSIIRGRPTSIAQVIREIIADYFERVHAERAVEATAQLAHHQYIAPERKVNG